MEAPAKVDDALPAALLAHRLFERGHDLAERLLHQIEHVQDRLLGQRQKALERGELGRPERGRARKRGQQRKGSTREQEVVVGRLWVGILDDSAGGFTTSASPPLGP
jgi:hypothetical protein